MAETQTTSGPLAGTIGKLDDALAALVSLAATELDVAAVAGLLGDALYGCYQAWTHRGDGVRWQEHRDDARRGLGAALALLQATPELTEQCAEPSRLVSQALALLASASLISEEGVADLPAALDGVAQASGRAPALLRLGRGLIFPCSPLAGRPAPDAMEASAAPARPATGQPTRDLDAVQALLDQASAAMLAPASPRPPPTATPASAASDVDPATAWFGQGVDARQLLRDRVRACVQDMAAMSTMRRPGATEGWARQERTERRLLARLDAVIACGVDQLQDAALELGARPLPDPDLGWALVMILGSIDHRDACDQALRIVRSFDLGDDDARTVLTEALGLAPHPRIELALRAWLAEAEPRRREMAVVALGARGVLSTAQLDAALADPDPAVVRAALRALLDCPLACSPALLERQLRHEDSAHCLPAIEAGLAIGLPAAVWRARELVQAGGEVAAHASIALALGGTSADGPVLLGLLAREPSPEVVEALGWYGSTEAIEPLLTLLAGDDKALAEAAAHALARITGVSPDAEGEVPEADALFSLRAAGTPIAEPSLDPTAWQRVWSRHGSRADRGLRYRWGRPYLPADEVAEASHPSSPPRVRRWAVASVAFVTGVRDPINLCGFVATQTAQLDALAARVQAVRAIPGAWPTRGGR